MAVGSPVRGRAVRPMRWLPCFSPESCQVTGQCFKFYILPWASSCSVGFRMKSIRKHLNFYKRSKWESWRWVQYLCPQPTENRNSSGALRGSQGHRRTRPVIDLHVVNTPPCALPSPWELIPLFDGLANFWWWEQLLPLFWTLPSRQALCLAH